MYPASILVNINLGKLPEPVYQKISLSKQTGIMMKISRDSYIQPLLEQKIVSQQLIQERVLVKNPMNHLLAYRSKMMTGENSAAFPSRVSQIPSK
jgi:hypothetical protein